MIEINSYHFFKSDSRMLETITLSLVYKCKNSITALVGLL